MVSLFVLTGRSLAIPLHISSCVAAQDDPFGGVDHQLEDPLTEVLWDEPGEAPVDWWNTGGEASWEVQDYLKAWRRFEGKKKVSYSIPAVCPSEPPIQASQFPTHPHVSHLKRDSNSSYSPTHHTGFVHQDIRTSPPGERAPVRGNS